MHVVDADTFTRKWVAASGAALAPPLPYPASPIEEVLTAMSKPSGGGRLWLMAARLRGLQCLLGLQALEPLAVVVL